MHLIGKVGALSAEEFVQGLNIYRAACPKLLPFWENRWFKGGPRYILPYMQRYGHGSNVWMSYLRPVIQ